MVHFFRHLPPNSVRYLFFKKKLLVVLLVSLRRLVVKNFSRKTKFRHCQVYFIFYYYFWDLCFHLNLCEFTSNNQVPSFNTRQNRHLYVPFSRGNTLFNSASVVSHRMYNKLLQSMKCCERIHFFRSALRELLLGVKFYSLRKYLKK